MLLKIRFQFNVRTFYGLHYCANTIFCKNVRIKRSTNLVVYKLLNIEIFMLKLKCIFIIGG